MKRGSALLIVLGMLSFMVVSAVGFSVYMRQGRLPSSYLRRNVSSRYLVKAALANAIEELDCGFMTKYEVGEDEDNSHPENGYMFGIYDDPYPGCGPDSRNGTRKSGNREFYGRNVSYYENGDLWFKRVFCPFGLLPYPTSKDDSVDEPPITVPTLTTEALAYLPTALIDDVRKVSRMTRTAMWRSLPYDAGRYAYTVVNVSDLFDINRLRAGEPRDSGPNRITLSTLTSDKPDDPANVDQGRADALDLIIDPDQNGKLKIGGQVVPFVSLADFGLSAIGSQYAPLMSYFGGGAQALFNGGTTPEHANSLFITDTWFPPTNSMDMALFDLAKVQPFQNYNLDLCWLNLKNHLNRTDKDLNNTVTIGEVFENNLGVGVACLFDYLDSDNVPCSFSLPTTEAVPMVIGVSAPSGLAPQFGSLGAAPTEGTYNVQGYYIPDPSTGQRVPTQVTIKRTCQQKGIIAFGGSVMVRCLAAYPFKRMFTSKRIQDGDFKVRGILKVWLADENMGCRPADQTSLYPNPTHADLIQMLKNGNATAAAHEGTATFVSQQFNPMGSDLTVQTPSFDFYRNDVKKTDDALIEFNLQFGSLSLQMPMCWEVTEEIVPDPAKPGLGVDDQSAYSPTPYKSLTGLSGDNTILRPLQADGSVNGHWKAEAAMGLDVNAQNGVKQLGSVSADLANDKFRLFAAVWVQILNRDGKVVDMVPACAMDDSFWLSGGAPPVGEQLTKCGSGAPLLNFKYTDGNPISYAATMTDADVQDALKAQNPAWTTLYAVDPRFNFAPEDWFSMSANSTVSKTEWESALGLTGSSSPILGRLGKDRSNRYDFVRDRDIFMFVSDQEYLQSIGELQFLPVMDMMDGTAQFPQGGPNGGYTPNFCGDSHATRTAPPAVSTYDSHFANSDRFWFTYSAYKTGDNLQDFFAINPYEMQTSGGKSATFVSGATDFRLNPFSDDMRVLAAATTCTPFDYYVASTNDNQLDSTTKGRKQNLMNAITSLDTMRSSYSFGNSQIARFSADDMADINDEISATFKDYIDNFNWNGKAQPSWEEAWDDLEWQNPGNAMINDLNSNFLGLNMNQNYESGYSFIHGVDRKYLYSFWRECFSNRQQLFLIFVRAEPASVGGGASGNVSSAQLGGRAVALVWRDPAIPTDTSGQRVPRRATIMNREDFRQDYKQDHPPHRTRVLFYHQFD